MHDSRSGPSVMMYGLCVRAKRAEECQKGFWRRKPEKDGTKIMNDFLINLNQRVDSTID